MNTDKRRAAHEGEPRHRRAITMLALTFVAIVTFVGIVFLLVSSPTFALQ